MYVRKGCDGDVMLNLKCIFIITKLKIKKNITPCQHDVFFIDWIGTSVELQWNYFIKWNWVKENI